MQIKMQHFTCDQKKVEWVNKIVPEEATVAENILCIPVECYKGKGVTHLYECFLTITDPGRKELLDDYQYVTDMDVPLSIVEGLTFYDELNLPSF